MKRLDGRALAAIAWVLAASAADCRAQDAAVKAAIAKGERIARNQCWPCHVVADDQKEAPILRTPTPSFRALANRPDATVEALGHFLEKTHWDMQSMPLQMPNQELTKQERQAVARYILSLRRP